MEKKQKSSWVQGSTNTSKLPSQRQYQHLRPHLGLLGPQGSSEIVFPLFKKLYGNQALFCHKTPRPTQLPFIGRSLGMKYSEDMLMCSSGWKLHICLINFKWGNIVTTY